MKLVWVSNYFGHRLTTLWHSNISESGFDSVSCWCSPANSWRILPSVSTTLMFSDESDKEKLYVKYHELKSLKGCKFFLKSRS